MKKVTLLLPDKITRTLGTSFVSRTGEVDFTARNLLKVLCEDSDYHERYKFIKDDVKILSIESIN